MAHAGQRIVMVFGVWCSISATGCLHAGHTRPVFFGGSASAMWCQVMDLDVTIQSAGRSS
jgi:hypothetical protein